MTKNFQIKLRFYFLWWEPIFIPDLPMLDPAWPPLIFHFPVFLQRGGRQILPSIILGQSQHIGRGE